MQHCPCSASSAVRAVAYFAALTTVVGSPDTIHVPTLQERGVWQNHLPGVIEVANFSQPVSLQLFLRGICLGDQVFLRGQMFALPTDQLRWSLSHAHLLQPKQMMQWKPQVFFKTKHMQVKARMLNVSREFVEPVWQSGHGDGLIIPIPFNASIPANLSEEPWMLGIEDWEYMHWLRPSTDLMLQCSPVQPVSDGPEVLHILPPIIGEPSSAALRLLDQQVRWDQAMGFKQTVIFITKEGFQEHLNNQALRQNVLSGHAAIMLWDGLPSCKGKPYCLKALNWSLSLLLFWDAREKWLFMSDLDEFFVTPHPTTVSTVVTGCLNLSIYSILRRFDAHCPACENEQVQPWESDKPLSFYTQRSTGRIMGKAMVSTLGTYAFAIHHGQAEIKLENAQEDCAYVMHLVNFFRSRVAYNQETLSKAINDSEWMWPLKYIDEPISA